MNAPEFHIGQLVYYAAAYPRGAVRVPCPLCFGKLSVQLILGNGEVQSIECSACGIGYNGPRGYIEERGPQSWVKSGFVTGISQRDGALRYEVENWGSDNVFATEAEAEACRVALHKQAQKDAEHTNEHILREKKKGLAWSVRYHQDCIRDFERKVEWHYEKLLISKEKVAAKKKGKVTA